MPEYVYRNSAGEERSIFMGMREEHPEAVTFRPDGGYDVALSNDPLAYRRVYGNFDVDLKPCTGNYPLASLNLPKHLKGEKCDSQGRVIIRNRHHENEICRKHNYVRVED